MMVEQSLLASKHSLFFAGVAGGTSPVVLRHSVLESPESDDTEQRTMVIPSDEQGATSYH